MYIQFFAQFAFGYFAMLAAMAVALSGRAALYIPVWAIVFLISACPIMVLFTNPVLRLPYTITSLITKMVFMVFCAIRNNKQLRPAPRANRWNAPICRILLTQKVSRVVFTTTFNAAKKVFRSGDPALKALNRFAAFRTSNCHKHNNPLTDKLVTCSGFTAISKGIHEVYHKFLALVNPEQHHYTTYVLQTVAIWH